jgi:hypothetical protein
MKSWREILVKRSEVGKSEIAALHSIVIGERLAITWPGCPFKNLRGPKREQRSSARLQ